MKNTEQIRLEEMLVAYIECAFWSSMHGDDHLDELGFDLSDPAREMMEGDCAKFLEKVDLEELPLEEMNPEQIGHDFWLTRNGHGAGFWDRGLGELGERLTKISKDFGEIDLYLGDDELVWIAG